MGAIRNRNLFGARFFVWFSVFSSKTQRVKMHRKTYVRVNGIRCYAGREVVLEIMKFLSPSLIELSFVGGDLGLSALLTFSAVSAFVL